MSEIEFTCIVKDLCYLLNRSDYKTTHYICAYKRECYHHYRYHNTHVPYLIHGSKCNILISANNKYLVLICNGISCILP